MIDFLAEHGALLALGVTCSLGVGLVCVFVARQPVHQQRLAELTVFGSLLWIVIATAPLPRAATATPPNVLAAAPADESMPASPSRLPAPTAPGPALETAPGPSFERLGAPSLLPSPRFEPSAKRVVQPAAVAAPSRATLPDADWVARCYLASVFLAAAVLVFARVRLHLIAARSSTPSPATMEIWRRLGPPPGARLLVGTTGSTPLSFGVLQPTVYVPSSLVEQGGPTLEAVLRHEIAHLRNGDALSRTLFNAAMPVLALHPFYWLLRSRAIFAAELRADARAAEAEGAEGYVAALVALFDQGGRPRRSLAASTVWSTESGFCRRMTMLLKNKRPIAQRTSWRWKALIGAAAALAVAFTAGLFGVVHAQPPKTQEKKSADVYVSPPEETQHRMKTAEPLTVQSADGRTRSVITKTATRTYPNSGAEAGLTVEPPALRPADTMTAWESISLQIAERRAKLAGARFLPGAAPFDALRLELEIMALESAKRVSGLEHEVQSVEKRLEELEREREMLSPQFAAEHPRLKQVLQRIDALRARHRTLCAEIEKERQSAEVRIRARAAQEVRLPEDVGMRVRGADQKTAQALAQTQASKARPLPSEEIQGAPSQEATAASREISAALARRLKQAEEQITKLNAENADLRKHAAKVGEFLTGTLSDAKPSTGLASIPWIRHQLRLAEAEPSLYDKRLAYYEQDLARVERLVTNGGASQEELQKAKTQVDLARAELRKSELLIDSLRTLLKELDEETARKAKTSPSK